VGVAEGVPDGVADGVDVVVVVVVELGVALGVGAPDSVSSRRGAQGDSRLASCSSEFGVRCSSSKDVDPDADTASGSSGIATQLCSVSSGAPSLTTSACAAGLLRPVRPDSDQVLGAGWTSRPGVVVATCSTYTCSVAAVTVRPAGTAASVSNRRKARLADVVANMLEREPKLASGLEGTTYVSATGRSPAGAAATAVGRPDPSPCVETAISTPVTAAIAATHTGRGRSRSARAAAARAGRPPEERAVS